VHRPCYFVALSLEEAEHLRGVVHMRRGGPVIPGSGCALGLRAVTKSLEGVLVDASQGYCAAPPLQQLTAHLAFRFLDSQVRVPCPAPLPELPEIAAVVDGRVAPCSPDGDGTNRAAQLYVDSRAVGTALRAVQANPREDRQAFFAMVRACRRRPIRDWKQAPVARVLQATPPSPAPPPRCRRGPFGTCCGGQRLTMAPRELTDGRRARADARRVPPPGVPIGAGGGARGARAARAEGVRRVQGVRRRQGRAALVRRALGRARLARAHPHGRRHLRGGALRGHDGRRARPLRRLRGGVWRRRRRWARDRGGRGAGGARRPQRDPPDADRGALPRPPRQSPAPAPLPPGAPQNLRTRSCGRGVQQAGEVCGDARRAR